MKNNLRVFYIALTTLPLIMGFSYSALYSFGVIGLVSKGFTFNHWIRLFSSSGAVYSILYTSLLTIVSLAIILLVALYFAWKCLLKKYTKKNYRTFILPLLFPPLCAGFAWYYILSPTGILSRIAHNIGLISDLDSFPRMVNDYFSIGIIITHVFLIFPLFTFLFIEQSKKEKINEMRLAAQNLGCSDYNFFTKIFTPLLISKIKPVIWLYGIFLMGTYEVPLILGRSSPQTISVFITEKMTRFNLEDIPVGHAMAIIYTILIFTLITFFIRKKTVSLF